MPDPSTATGVTMLLSTAKLETGVSYSLPLVNSKYGVFKLKKTGTVGPFIVRLQGSFNNTTFFNLATINETMLDANDSAAVLTMLFPYVRAACVSYFGVDGVLTCYLQE